MESEVSLLCSQETATGHYPQPDVGSTWIFINFNIAISASSFDNNFTCKINPKQSLA
jgi:hypothetical protein